MDELRRLISKVAKSLCVDLDETEVLRALKDIIRWRTSEKNKTGMVKTFDGSLTLWSAEFGEPYHSVSAGAVRESIEKFVVPSRIIEKSIKRKRVRILDVGFGLGYNLAVALYKIREANPATEVEIISMEKKIVEDIPVLREPYTGFHRLVTGLLPEGEKEGVRLKVLLGDARKNVATLTGFGADAVFHDPFSPFKNPELWTLDFLEKVKSAMSLHGYWVSYTSSLPVRKALRDLGFRVGSSKPVGRKRSGTVATLRGEVEPLGMEEEEKLRGSPFSVPFRDPELDRDPLEILVEYRLSVLLREREASSGRQAGERKSAP